MKRALIRSAVLWITTSRGGSTSVLFKFGSITADEEVVEMPAEEFIPQGADEYAYYGDDTYMRDVDLDINDE